MVIAYIYYAYLFFSTKENTESCAETEWDTEVWVFRSRVVTSSMCFHAGVSRRQSLSRNGGVPLLLIQAKMRIVGTCHQKVTHVDVGLLLYHLVLFLYQFSLEFAPLLSVGVKQLKHSKCLSQFKSKWFFCLLVLPQSKIVKDFCAELW